MYSLFSDDQSQWQSTPKWVNFFIQMGLMARESAVNKSNKKIALISAPFESVGAGLIALGAHVQALSDPLANDVDGHFDSLAGYARQYLSRCSKCTDRCNPDRTRCGYANEASGIIKSISKPVHTFQICDVGSSGERRISFKRISMKSSDKKSAAVTTIFPSGTAPRYHVSGEPPPNLIEPEGKALCNPYAEIVPGATMDSDNLKRTFSGICLAGRAAGESATREAYSRTIFKCSGTDFSLSKLLTVHAWSTSNQVSRMLYFNPRTGEFDRRAGAPQLVVADGHDSFLRVLDNRDFQSSSIIGVFHRAIEREKSEEIGNKLQSLRQWYDNDTETQEKVRAYSAPRGVTMKFLRQRVPR
jgi:hypothetical protein